MTWQASDSVRQIRNYGGHGGNESAITMFDGCGMPAVMVWSRQRAFLAAVSLSPIWCVDRYSRGVHLIVQIQQLVHLIFPPRPQQQKQTGTETCVVPYALVPVISILARKVIFDDELINPATGILIWTA
jgi:hypothetical protein